MKRLDGFALITSLLLLVVLAAMGAGAIFLANMNLGVAENGRTHAIAFANAEGGLESAIVGLGRAFNDASPREFPASFSTADVPAHPSLDFEVTGYEVFSADSARVAVRGLGPRDAEYVSEAVIVMVPGLVDPFYARGMVSEQSIAISGASGRFVDAGMHSNDGLWLPGWDYAQFVYCTAPRIAETGRCPAGSEVAYEPANVPLSVWQGGSQDCGPPAVVFCERQGGNRVVKDDYLVADEVIIQVDYDGRRFRAAGGTTDEEGNVTTVGALSLDGVIQYAGAACGSAEFLCLTGNHELTPLEVEGRTVVADGNITINCDQCALNDTVLISTNGAVDVGDVATATNVRVFSEQDLDATGQWLGESTLASSGDVNFSGSAQLFQGWAGSMVGMTVIAEGDIHTNGGGGTEAVGVFIAGGDFHWDGGGGVYIFGSVLIKGTVTINGGYTIDAGNELSNPDLETGDALSTVVSRR